MAKPEKRWQLLLVADDGRIVPFKRIKGIAVTLVVLLLILGILCGGLTWQLAVEKLGHGRTREKLADAQRQAAHYKSEHELVSAELVLAEARMEKAGLSIPRRQEQAPQPQSDPTDVAETPSAAKTEADQKTVQPAVTAPSTPAPSPSSEAAVAPAVSAPPKDTAQKPKAATTRPTERSPVALSDLEIEHNPAKRILQAQFRVSNTGPRSSPVAGRCVVVLKSDRLDPTAWLAMPEVALVDGKPDGLQGQEFKIARFIDVEIEARDQTDPSPFKIATVYVFDTSATQMLKKDFAIDLPAPAPEPKPAAEPESAATPVPAVPDPDPASTVNPEPVEKEDSRAPF